MFPSCISIGLLALIYLLASQDSAASASVCTPFVSHSVAGLTNNLVGVNCEVAYVFDNITFRGGPSGLIAGSTTLLPGGPPAIISRHTFSLGTSASSLAIDGTLTPLLQPSITQTPSPGFVTSAGLPSLTVTLSTYTFDGIHLTGNPTSLVSGTNTLRPGDPSMTISNHTLSIPAFATRGQINVDGTFTNLPTQRRASSSTPLASITPSDATSVTDILGATSTATVPPANLSTQLVSSTWTSNTWLTTTILAKETIVPVLVGCAHCGEVGGGVIIWNYPPMIGVSFQFPKLPNGDIVDPFHLPCIPIPLLKSCLSPPINDPPVDGTAGGLPEPDDAVTDDPGSASLNSQTSPSLSYPKSLTSFRQSWSSTRSSAISSTTSRQICSYLCSACANNDPPSSYPTPSKYKKRISPYLRKPYVTSEDALALKKRALPLPGDAPWDGNLDSYLYDQIAFAEDAGHQVNLGGHGVYGTSSALALPLANSRSNMVVQGLYGCTSVIVVSRQLVWGSHFWEGESFQASQAKFEATVLDVLGPGDGTPEMPGLSQYTDRGGLLAPETKPQGYIVTPGHVSGSGNMFYPEQVAKISTRLKQILGQGVPINPILYDPVDLPSSTGSDDGSGSEAGSGSDDEWSPSGKVLFQYDPDQTRCEGVQTAIWRLWIEDNRRGQNSWAALPNQLVPHRKRQEIETGSAAVCPTSSTTSSSAKESSTSTYAVYLALQVIEQEMNQIENLPPNYYTLYYNEIWAMTSDSEPDYCGTPAKSTLINGAAPNSNTPYPTATITNLQPSGTLGPTCAWIPNLGDSGLSYPGHLSCNVNPTSVACQNLAYVPTACGYSGATVHPQVQCVWGGE